MKDYVASGGLLNRRLFLQSGASLSGLAFAAPLLASQDWQRYPGQPPSDYGEPSRHARLRRDVIGSHPFGPGAGGSGSPLQSLNGTITPTSLHFERHHAGIPDIDPEKHELVIYGDVKKPLRFTLENLLAYPLETHTYFLECSGNSARKTFPKAIDGTAGELNSLISGAEWTGVPNLKVNDGIGVSAAAEKE